MARSLPTCDMCGKPIEEVKAKLFISPARKDAARRHHHANYTAHADIGACCLPELNRLVKFTRRVQGARRAA